ncbi:MAG: hypothetical protein ABSA48_15355 [Terracidiphilus sp.]|jgi:hypothetical protein
MPISIALLLCLPIGFLFYFEARWLIRYALGRFEQRERRAARFLGVFGASLIPLIYCCGLIEDAFPGRLGETMAIGLLAVATWGLVGSIFVTLNERK